MLNTILGSKGKMGQTFVQDTRIPVTHINVEPCVITQVKDEGKNGYWAIQLGFGEKKLKNITKPLQGHLKGAIKDKKAPRFLREVRLDSEPEEKVGDKISASDIFKKGDVVAVTGTSKGKGFAGVVKRWRFAGGPKTHGQSDRERAPGSIGQRTTPGRVWKGKKMAGRMGGRKVTVSNLVVVDINNEKNELLLSGPVPGTPGSLLKIKKLSSGKLEELIQEAPQQQVVEGEPEAEEEKSQPQGSENQTQEG